MPSPFPFGAFPRKQGNHKPSGKERPSDPSVHGGTSRPGRGEGGNALAHQENGHLHHADSLSLGSAGLAATGQSSLPDESGGGRGVAVGRSGEQYRYFAPQYKCVSFGDDFFDHGTGGNTFTGYPSAQKFFFGKIMIAGNAWTNPSELSLRMKGEEIYIHIPGLTYNGVTNVNGLIKPMLGTKDARPLPLMVDSQGRFGLVLPTNPPYIYVKMTGTLWRKVIFDSSTVDTIVEKGWNGAETSPTQVLKLRMGDVNEDNVIKVGTTDLAYLNNRIGGRVTLLNDGVPRIYIYDLPCDLNRDNKVDQDDYDNYDTLLRPTSNVPGAEFTP